ncbi:MAG: DNRLRE domain-containing protein [Clostridiaceae bacterium]|nr:DNRLRE domain-containing protein [Clostridiaceae bacterium]
MKSIKIKPKIKFAQISSDMPNSNVTRSHSMYIGRIYNGHIYRVLLKIPLSDIPENAVITKATLKVPSISYGHGSKYKAFLITQAWSLYTVTWNNQPSYDSAISIESDDINTPPGNGPNVPRDEGYVKKRKKYKFDITQIVRGWMNGTIENHGLILKNKENKNCRYLKIFTDQSSNCKPVVEIKYYLPCSCICEVIPTQFLESIETIQVTDQLTYTTVKDISLTKTVTVFVSNIGASPIIVTLEISPDGINFAKDNSIQVEPGTNAAVVPYIFAKYLRAGLNTTGGTSTAVIWYQMQE